MTPRRKRTTRRGVQGRNEPACSLEEAQVASRLVSIAYVGPGARRDRDGIYARTARTKPVRPVAPPVDPVAELEADIKWRKAKGVAELLSPSWKRGWPNSRKREASEAAASILPSAAQPYHHRKRIRPQPTCQRLGALIARKRRRLARPERGKVATAALFACGA